MQFVNVRVSVYYYWLNDINCIFYYYYERNVIIPNVYIASRIFLLQMSVLN